MYTRLPCMPDNQTKKRLDEMAHVLLQRNDFQAGRSQWSRFYYTREAERFPSLLIDDFSGIPFISDIPGIEWYQLRSRVRAFDGDYYLSTMDDNPSYECYNRQMLNLGAATCLRVNHSTHPFFLARGCYQDPEVLKHLKTLIAQTGGLTIHPYMGVHDVWDLAELLHGETGGTIAVLAPPPHVTEFVNNKSAFHAVVSELLGLQLLPKTSSAYTIEEIVTHIRALQNDSEAIGIKLTNCASAMGNLVLERDHLGELDDEELAAELMQFFGRYEIVLPHEVLVTQWFHNVVHSPSTQCWIPSAPTTPFCEGMYDQILHGKHKVFVGSRPSILPHPVQEAFIAASCLLASLFQRIDYRGRCSFDAILTGEDHDPEGLKFVECNGRWGGTSIPMFLYQRICLQAMAANRPQPPTYAAMDYTDTRLKGRDFRDLEKILAEQLYNPTTGTGHFVIYNAGCIKEFGKFDIIVMGNSYREVTRLMTRKLPELLDQGLTG